MFPLYEIFNVLAKIGFCATVIINLIFINVTLIYIKRIPKAYKTMMIAFAAICILFAIVELLAQPCIHNFNGAVMFFSLNSDAFFSQDGSQSILLCYGGCYCSLISFICVQFVFRYFTISEHPLLQTFYGKQVILWVLYVCGFGFLYGFIIYWNVQPVEFTDEYMREEILRVYGRDINQTARFISVAYENGSVRWPMSIFLASETSIISSQYFIIIYCALKMHKAIKHELRQISNSNQKLEKQFYNALLVQIFLPTFLLNLPCGIVLSIPLLDMEISCQSGIIYALFSLYPPIDSVATMIIVKEYRKCMKQFLNDIKEMMVGGVKSEETEKPKTPSGRYSMRSQNSLRTRL